ncbi:hypothetical protein [Lentzea fradiae]|uniref:hypothetical protein n=1 Tax=Lentzea fradiae TaxID=200378 RepID=UPI00115FD962|nr:hypothetical protein [Lentzea fradiae]
MQTSASTSIPGSVPAPASPPLVAQRATGSGPGQRHHVQRSHIQRSHSQHPEAQRPHVQRDVGGAPRPAANGAPAVVRPAPPRPLDSGQRLPPIAYPANVPTTIGRDHTPTAPATPQRTAVPAVRWSAGTQVVQRASKQAPGRRAPVSASPEPEPTSPGAWQDDPATGQARTKRAEPDLEELARRLLDPLGRLLRAELRHGRERAGRLHDRGR